MANFKDIINGDKPVLVDFHAEWCGPCKMLAPIIQEVKNEIGEEVRILKIDIDKNPQLSTQFQVTGVPTLIVYKKGKAVWRASGVQTKHTILQQLKAAAHAQ